MKFIRIMTSYRYIHIENNYNRHNNGSDHKEDHNHKDKCK